MQIKLNLNVFLFLILFLLTNQLEVYSLMMIFALLHELAHMICGILLKLKPSTFRIMPLGFSIEFINFSFQKEEKHRCILKKIIIALAGPAFNLLVVFIGIACKMDVTILYVNLLILIFNLLPIYPLDGGRIMKNVFQLRFKKQKARELTNKISNITVIILTMIASIAIYQYKNIAILLILVTLWVIVIRENKKIHTYNKIYKVIDKSGNYL